MSESELKLKKTAEFSEWYGSLRDTERTRIDARLELAKQGHFGWTRSLGSGLFEWKWKTGMRVYYFRKRICGADVIVLWGGFKGSQKTDITKARRLIKVYENEIAKEAQQDENP